MARRRSFQRHIARARRRARALLLGRGVVTSAVGVGLALAAPSAWAQAPPAPAEPKEPPKDAKDDVSMPGVDVKGERTNFKIEEPSLYKLPDPIQQTPQSISVIPERMLEERGFFTLREALRTVPGISLAAGEGGGRQGDNLTLRGFPAGNDIYLDAVRDLGQYPRDTFNLEAIEVLRGPSSVLFGRGSTGGIINQVSKSPRLTPFYEISGTVGSGPQGRTTADLNQPFGNSGAARLNLMFSKGEAPGRDYVRTETWGVAPSVGIGLNGPTRLVLSYFYQSDDNMPDYGLPYLRREPAPVRNGNFYGLPDRDYEHDDVHIGTVKVEHDFTENVRLRNTLRLASLRRGSVVSIPAIVGGPFTTLPLNQIQVTRTGTERGQLDQYVLNNTELVAKFSTWGLKHTLVSGVDASYETSDIQRYTFTGVPPTTLVNPFAFPNLSGMGRVKNFNGSSHATGVGVYAVDELSITEWLRIMGGLRYDLFDAHFRNRFAAQKFSRTDEALSPRAALVVLPTKAQTYYFSWGTSFNPSAEALVLALNNAGSEPEKNETFELGAKLDLLEGRLGFRTAVFQTFKQNARTTDPVLGVQVTDGKQRVRGFELELVGQILRGWNIWLAYTYLDSRILESNDIQTGIRIEGNRLANVPENTASIWTTWDITPQWQVGGGANFVDLRYANNDNLNEVPSYVRGDVMVAYRPITPLELRFNVINISDAKYFDAVHPSHVIPGNARTFLLTGTWRF
jgi:catecholate siderophore receptor